MNWVQNMNRCVGPTSRPHNGAEKGTEMVRDYQCWPDKDGKHAWLRHKCKDGYVTWMLPALKIGWHFDGQKVTPSVVCNLCNFHMMVEKTHDADPETPNAEVTGA